MRMLARYGCRLVVLEPVPGFADRIKQLFRENPGVTVHPAALGGREARATFHFHDDGTSAYRGSAGAESHEAAVIDVASLVPAAPGESIACLKLNIEGGEYDVLERLLDTGLIDRIDSLLVQFHAQPAGWEDRWRRITERLPTTHDRVWCYRLVWEKWTRKSPARSGDAG
jgi:FkbM family methyltransferase